jgi:hypothetical protein
MRLTIVEDDAAIQYIWPCQVSVLGTKFLAALCYTTASDDHACQLINYRYLLLPLGVVDLLKVKVHAMLHQLPALLINVFGLRDCDYDCNGLYLPYKSGSHSSAYAWQQLTLHPSQIQLWVSKICKQHPKCKSSEMVTGLMVR